VLVSSNDDINQFKSRAALSTLLIFEIFGVGLFSLSLYGAMVRHVGWEGAILMGVLCISIYIWWRVFFVEIDEVELRYRSLLSKKVIALRHITRVVSKINDPNGNRPPNRIEIYGTVNGRDMEFDINVKPFPLSDVVKMEHLLRVL